MLNARRFALLLFIGLFFHGPSRVSAADLSRDWKYSQDIQLASPGLAKLKLPNETINAADASLRDVRLVDDQGTEIPYFVFEPHPRAPALLWLPRTHPFLYTGKTVVQILVGTSAPYDGLVIQSPSPDFLKSAKVEGSQDGHAWTTLAENRPVFKQSNGANHLLIDLPQGTWSRLRLTLDDSHTAAIPIGNVAIRHVGNETIPTEIVPIPQRLDEAAPPDHQTRLMLQAPYRHMNVVALTIDVSDPVFARPVLLTHKTADDGRVMESAIGGGFIYSVVGSNGAANTRVEISSPWPDGDVTLSVDNGNSPPLTVTRVSAVVTPRFLIFNSLQGRRYRLLCGNPVATTPQYDIADLSSRLGDASAVMAGAGPLATNALYQAPDAVPELSDVGAEIDLSNWKYRRPVRIAVKGVQALELTPDVLAEAGNPPVDLRLARDQKQIPYLYDAMGVMKTLSPSVTKVSPAQSPEKTTRWELSLPAGSFSFSRLLCDVSDPLFGRTAVLSEELEDERGETQRSELARAVWVRNNGEEKKTLALNLGRGYVDGLSFHARKVFLDIENGDNPPIDVQNIRLEYSVPRLYFKSNTIDPAWLYYGNPRARPPAYDIALASAKLLAAEKNQATLEPAETLQAARWWDMSAPSGAAKYFFWAVLALVVLALVGVIAKLLPEESEEEGGEGKEV